MPASIRNIVIAMDNCANQLVLYGEEAPIAALQETLTAKAGFAFPSRSIADITLLIFPQ